MNETIQAQSKGSNEAWEVLQKTIDIPSNEFMVARTTDRCEREYPILTEEFREIQKRQYDLFCAKMLSYGLGNIAVGTNLETPEEKRLSETGIWFRMNDKIQRLKQLVLLKVENPLVDEGIEDAYKDLSVYGIIAQIVRKGSWKK